MTSTTGAMHATTVTTNRRRCAIAPATWSGFTTSTTTATGVLTRNMATSGSLESTPDGLPTTKDTGHGSIRGGGPGSMMTVGDTHLFTTAAGCRSRAAGDGFRGRWQNVPSTRRRSSFL